MSSGYILIGAILILGGFIAVSGDRIGTKVGKARLSLFKLRPRQTATLVTLATGTLLSASVLTLIFGASEQLRIGVFDLQKIQRKLTDTKENLARALEQKDRIQQELTIARNEQSEAQDLLAGINKSFKDELLKQSVAAQNLKNTQKQLQLVSDRRNELVREVTEISRQRRDLLAQQQGISARVETLAANLSLLEANLQPLRQQLASVAAKRVRLQQQLDTVTVDPDLMDKTRRLQNYEQTAKKLEREVFQRNARLTSLESQLQTQQQELLDVKTQVDKLDTKLAVRQAQLKDQDKQHKQLEREFQTRGLQLKARDKQLKKIESQMKTNRQGLASLEKEVNSIEQEYHKIRQGNIGILRNQVLASTILRASSPEIAAREINNLLVQANLNALQATSPDEIDSKQNIIEISATQLSKLKEEIKENRNYAVRIFSVSNYALGEKKIQVFIDATPDRKLFDREDKVAEASIDIRTMNEEQIRQQLNIVMGTCQLRARKAGILEDRPQVGDGQLSSYVQFLDRVKAQTQPLEIQAIVERDTYTLGPLVIRLQAVAGGKVLFST